MSNQISSTQVGYFGTGHTNDISYFQIPSQRQLERKEITDHLQIAHLTFIFSRKKNVPRLGLKCSACVCGMHERFTGRKEGRLAKFAPKNKRIICSYVRLNLGRYDQKEKQFMIFSLLPHVVTCNQVWTINCIEHECILGNLFVKVALYVQKFYYAHSLPFYDAYYRNSYFAKK